jgi:hypothetical protein
MLAGGRGAQVRSGAAVGIGGGPCARRERGPQAGEQLQAGRGQQVCGVSEQAVDDPA